MLRISRSFTGTAVSASRVSASFEPKSLVSALRMIVFQPVFAYLAHRLSKLLKVDWFYNVSSAGRCSGAACRHTACRWLPRQPTSCAR